jgi:hypothetical protein
LYYEIIVAKEAGKDSNSDFFTEDDLTVTKEREEEEE